MGQLEARGGDKAMRDGMLGLQDIVTSMMQGANDPDQAWLRTAHFIMARIHRFCATLRPELLAAEVTLHEEREAANRAKSVRKSSSTNQQGGSGFPTNRGNGNGKRPNPNSNRGQPNPNRTKIEPDKCPFHNGASHSLYECKTFLSHVKQMGNHQASATTLDSTKKG